MAISNLMNKSFLTRTISGVILAIIIILTGLFGGDILFGLVAVVSLIGLFEVYRVVEIHNNILGYIGYAAAIAYYAVLRFLGTEYIMPVIIGMLLLVLAAYVFSFPKYEATKITMAVFGFVYVVILMSYLYQIRETSDGIYTFWLVFIGSWVCDTCAYLTGVTCGKHKMAPVLSPKKSIEGAVGGVIGSALVGGIYGFVIADKLTSIPYPAITFAVMCGIAGLVSMVGDLSASAIKRNYDVKDYGALIPGHGGILDRFDSVIFIAPVIYYIIFFIA